MSQFVLMWDNTGLEYIGDVTAADQNKMWSALQGKPATVTIPNLMHMKLRAQANPQRHYEIYFCDAQDGITVDDLRDMFESSPQMAADTIRKLGHCFYSDRADADQVVIT